MIRSCWVVSGLLLVSLAALGSTTSDVDSSYCLSIEEPKRFDCHPDVNASPESCYSRGCCWVEATVAGAPYCFYGSNSTSYVMGPVTTTPSKQSVQATRVGTSPWPNDISTLNIEAFHESNTRLRIKISDANSHRFEIPQEIIERPVDGKLDAGQHPNYAINFAEDDFMIEVTRPDGGLLMNLSAVNFVYAEQFLQASFFVPEKRLFGLGEHRGPLMQNLNDWKVLGIWNRAEAPTEPYNLYGSHPMYVMIGDTGLAHGVVLMNSNAMDVTLQPAPAVTWRTIGGILDFYVLTGPKPDDVIQQYFDLIGRPTLPAYWSFGFHLCRWGYVSSNSTWDLVRKMREIEFPQETQWNDIDYMREYMDFTYDHEKYDTLPELVEDLHAHKQRYMMIVDPGICSTKPSSALQLGSQMKIWVNTSDGVTPIEGNVWPGNTYYPDFTNPRTLEFWSGELARYHSVVPFDGIWIDMNEPSNFVQGSTSGCTDDAYDNPPYTPQILDNSLTMKTLCASAQHYAGSHYDLHNLYALTEAMVTREALQDIYGDAQRSVIISRSSFMSHGRHASHWTADTVSFNIFGVTMVGADICGFNGNTTEELCTRWMQMGAFYTFMRNHNTEGDAAQDPTVFSTHTQNIMKHYTLLRYEYLPYLYTEMYLASSEGSTVLKGLGFEFSSECYKTCAIDTQYMWGKAVMVAPVLESGASSVQVYFPANQTWYDLETKAKVSSGAETLTIDAPIEKLPLFARSGQIVVTQKPELYLTDARANNFTLEAYLGDGQTHLSGSGQLFWDDGQSVIKASNKDYTFVNFQYEKVSSSYGYLASTVVNSGYKNPPLIDSVRLVGSDVAGVSQVTLTQAKRKRALQFSVNGTVLTIQSAAINTNEKFYLSWK